MLPIEEAVKISKSVNLKGFTFDLSKSRYNLPEKKLRHLEQIIHAQIDKINEHMLPKPDVCAHFRLFQVYMPGTCLCSGSRELFVFPPLRDIIIRV